MKLSIMTATGILKLKTVKRAALVAALMSTSCFAQQVGIRVVNGSNRQPLSGWKLTVFFVNPSQSKDAVKGSPPVVTNSSGVALFALPKPTPELLKIYAFPPTTEKEWYPAFLTTETSVLLLTGVQCEDGKTKPADPGQILVLAHRVTLWDKILRTTLGPLLRE